MKIYSQDREMDFGKEKCAMQITKNGKQHLMDGTKLRNQDKIRMFREKEANKYLGKLEANTIRQVEMKKKLKVSQEN